MKTFNQYLSHRELAHNIVENNIDVDVLCENILQYLQENGYEKFNEAWFGIPGLARAASGIGGAVGGIGADAARGIGKSFKSVGQGIYGGAKAGLEKAGQAIGQAGRAAGKVIGQAGKAVGQYVGDKYDTARRAEAVRQVQDRLVGLEDAMKSLGISPVQIQSILDGVNQLVTQSNPQ